MRVEKKLMKKGREIMKYLRIDNSKVYYINKSGEENPLDQISKEDLLFLFKKSLENDFEFDEYNESLIQNKVHQLLYKELYSKLKSFLAQKDELEKEIDNLYKEAMEKYSK